VENAQQLKAALNCQAVTPLNTKADEPWLAAISGIARNTAKCLSKRGSALWKGRQMKVLGLALTSLLIAAPMVAYAQVSTTVPGQEGMAPYRTANGLCLGPATHGSRQYEGSSSATGSGGFKGGGNSGLRDRERFIFNRRWICRNGGGSAHWWQGTSANSTSPCEGSWPDGASPSGQGPCVLPSELVGIWRDASRRGKEIPACDYNVWRANQVGGVGRDLWLVGRPWRRETGWRCS